MNEYIAMLKRICAGTIMSEVENGYHSSKVADIEAITDAIDVYETIINADDINGTENAQDEINRCLEAVESETSYLYFDEEDIEKFVRLFGGINNG